MKYLKPHRLHCFSPPVMLATFVLEISFALYALWRYKLTAVSRLVVALLVFLAIFQGAEYVVCEGAFGLSGEVWSRIGFMAITLLPPLGLHLAMVLARHVQPPLLMALYGSAAAFVVFFMLAPGAITTQVCQGNYVIFDVAPGSLALYVLYYYGWLVTGIVLSWRWAQRYKAANSRALKALAIGYLAFLVPTTALNLVDSSTLAAVPSIMCGFAVLLAVTLIGWVLPVAGIPKSRAKMR